MARYIAHANPEQIDLQLDDHWFHIPAEEPFEVDSTFYCDKLMEIYGPVYGLVELRVERSRLGISIDMAAGLVEAQKALKSSYMRAIRKYVDDQLTDRIRKGLPALPPLGRAELAIRELHVDLKKRYGFSPIDWEGEEAGLYVPGTAPQPTIAAPAAPDPRIDYLESQLHKSNLIIAAMAKSLGVDVEELEDEALAKGVQEVAATPRRGRKPAATPAEVPNPQPVEA